MLSILYTDYTVCTVVSVTYINITTNHREVANFWLCKGFVIGSPWIASTLNNDLGLPLKVY